MGKANSGVTLERGKGINKVPVDSAGRERKLLREVPREKIEFLTRERLLLTSYLCESMGRKTRCFKANLPLNGEIQWHFFF